MNKVSFLFLLLSYSVFSQQTEYEKAKSYYYNNELNLASESIESAIKKAKTNKSNYYLLFANILKSKNVIDSSLYYYTKVENDYLNRNVKDSLLLTIASKMEFYRYTNAKKKSNF